MSATTITKVFVGNLAFQATDQDLTEAFANCGKVKSGVIITRGRRSLGYGFVDFYAPEDAARAVTAMNQSEFRNRVIKVELVRDTPPRPPRMGNERGQGSGNFTNIGPNSNLSDNVAEDNQEGGAAPRRKNVRKPRRRNPANRVPKEVEGEVHGGDGEGAAPIAKGRAPRRRNNENNQINNSQNAGNAGGTRNNMPAEPPKEKILSKTAVFVANLPFSVDDEALTKIFDGLNVKSAKVVKTRTGRSRGYGFVDFESEGDQQNAIKSKNNAVVSGTNGADRNISVTVSHSVAPAVGEGELPR